MSVVYKTVQANFSRLSYSDFAHFGSSHLDLLDSFRALRTLSFYWSQKSKQINIIFLSYVWVFGGFADLEKFKRLYTYPQSTLFLIFSLLKVDYSG